MESIAPLLVDLRRLAFSARWSVRNSSHGIRRIGVLKLENPYLVSEHQASGDFQSLGPKFDSQLRVMQIIAIALMMGVLSFLGIVLVVTKGEVFGQKGPTLITSIAAVFAGMMVVAHVVVPSIIAKTHLRMLNGSDQTNSSPENRIASLVSVYQIRLIVGLALLEGAAFFNLVALMLGKHVLSTVMTAVLLCLMLLKFPTRTKVSWWVQDRMREFNT